MTHKHMGQITLGDRRAVLNDDWSITVYARIEPVFDGESVRWLRRAWFAFDHDFLAWAQKSFALDLYGALRERREVERDKLRQRIAARAARPPQRKH